MIDHNQIVEALRTVLDPETGQDIVEASRITELKIKDKIVYFVLDATNYDSAVRTNIHMALTQAVQDKFKEAEVHIHMKSSEPASSTQSSKLGHIKNIIAIASGKGGVGKSTIAANLAVAMRKSGAQVGLIDADFYGPSIPTMFGLKGERPKVKELYGKPKIVPLEAYGIYVMSIGFIVEPEDAVILRGPRLSGLVKQFLNDCLWPRLDYLIIDLPPGTGDIQLTLVQSVPVTGAIIVTTPQEVSVIDAVKAMNMFMKQNIEVPILGVVENMSWFTPEELPDNKYYIFGKGGGETLAKKGNTILLGQVPLIQSIRERSDNGNPVAVEDTGTLSEIFKKLANSTISSLERRNETKDPTKKVQITT